MHDVRCLDNGVSDHLLNAVKTNGQAFNKATYKLSGAVSSPLAGPCGGMDAATEPPGTDSRRVPRA
ncbi:hypothetical protein P0963_23425, partial [Xanthomonas hortorum pv. gardneri]|uniref:hypothetical protein n=1 Tax=Xanthomonas hortorum TaxID=56454 RepID=UPI00398372CC